MEVLWLSSQDVKNAGLTFEEGMTLSRLCTDRLEAIEKKVEILLQTPQGKEEVVPFKEET